MNDSTFGIDPDAPLPEGIEVKITEPTYESLGLEEIEHRFGFHKAAIESEDVIKDKHAKLRRQFKLFAAHLDIAIPAGREKALLFTHLEEASMWAHKGLARSGELVED